MEIAELTKGDYYRARNYTGLRDAFSSIDELEKTEHYTLECIVSVYPSSRLLYNRTMLKLIRAEHSTNLYSDHKMGY